VSYYRSPMGDYKTYGYGGDPGFLSRLWKKVKPIAGVVAGAVLGPIGGAVVQGLLKPRGTTPRQVIQTPTSFPGVGMQAGMFPAVPAVIAAGGRVLAGRTVAAAAAGATAATMLSGPGGQPVCPSGYHLAKDGSGRLVRNRRMNVANPRALRRSMRRVQGFEKLARRTINFTRRVKMKTRKS